MRVAVEIALSDEKIAHLGKLSKSRSVSVRLAERSQIVLLAGTGMTNEEIGDELDITRQKAGRWRNRYAKNRHQGIEKDLPRGGKNSVDQSKLRSKIIKITTQEKPKDATHWSTRSLAKKLGVNHSFVNRVWREVGLKPHLTHQFKIIMTQRLKKSYTMSLVYICRHQKAPLYFALMRKARFKR